MGDLRDSGWWQMKGNNLLPAIRWTLLAWCSYAVLEYGLSSVAPVVSSGNSVYTAAHWRSTLILLGAYAAIAIAVGAGLGVLVRFLPRWRAALADLGVLSVCCAVMLNIWRTAPLTLVAMQVSLVCAVLAGLIGARLSTKRWSGPLACFARPLPACVLLLGLPWAVFPWVRRISWLSHNNVLIGLASAAAIAVAFFAVWFVERWSRLFPWSSGWRSNLYLGNPALRLIACGAALVLTGLAFEARTVAFEAPRSPAPASLNRAQPNVIVLTLDTVRADHMSLYGYSRDTTPVLRTIAQDAAVYRSAVSPGDMTLSSHASILTGLYPSAHGAHFANGYANGRPLAQRFTTLAEVLAEHGYSTGAVVANYAYLSRSFGFQQGFQYYDDRAPVPLISEHAQPFLLREGLCPLLRTFAPASDFERPYRSAGEINSEVAPLLKRFQAASRPFFLLINYTDGHTPYLPPPPFDSRFPGNNPDFRWSSYSNLVFRVSAMTGTVPPGDKRHLLSQYDGAIAYLDSEIGRMVGALKNHGLYDNTLLIITSDHGEAFGERSLLNHAVSVYQDQVHVPLLVRNPLQKNGGAMYDQAVSTADIFPTVLSSLGFDVPKEVQAVSLSRRVSGNPAVPVYSESFPNPFLKHVNSRFDRIERAVIMGKMKMIISTHGKHELFNLSSDADERSNLYFHEQAEASDLEAMLSTWLKTVPAVLSAPTDVDRQAVDRLRSLGYVDPR
jgi:arylsulfatase A-like enzyme